MTAQQTKTINAINEDLEAARWLAEQAAREVAGLIEETVIIAVEVKIAEGRIELARAMWRAYRDAQKGSK